MGSQNVTCHPAEVAFPPLPQTIKAGTQFSDAKEMQGWVDIIDLVTYRCVYLPKVGHPYAASETTTTNLNKSH